MYRNEQDTNELKHKQVCIVETEKKTLEFAKFPQHQIQKKKGNECEI